MPENFLCPITRELMRDPVVTDDGHTYDRSAIEQWFEVRLSLPRGRFTDTLSTIPACPITYASASPCALTCPWPQMHDTSPLTGGMLPSRALRPNYSLRQMILEWVEKYGTDDN